MVGRRSHISSVLISRRMRTSATSSLQWLTSGTDYVCVYESVAGINYSVIVSYPVVEGLSCVAVIIPR